MSSTKKPTAPSQQQNYNVKFIRNSYRNMRSQSHYLQVSQNLLTRCRVICFVTDTLSDELHRDPAELMHHCKQKVDHTNKVSEDLALQVGSWQHWADLLPVATNSKPDRSYQPTTHLKHISDSHVLPQNTPCTAECQPTLHQERSPCKSILT